MTISITNHSDFIQLSFSQQELLNSFNGPETWIECPAKISCGKLLYTYLISIQGKNIKILFEEVCQLLDNHTSQATFYCLEEWLSIDIMKKDASGHFRVNFTVNDPPLEIKSSFDISYGELLTLKSDMEHDLKSF